MLISQNFSCRITSRSIMKLELLPEECMVEILSRSSPKEACQLSAVAAAVRDAAESEVLWEKFLPSDYREIISRLVFPVGFTSKKDLFLKLSRPLLIDDGTKAFYIDKFTNKKCYMLSARELSIAWSSSPLYWCWKPFLPSRFPEVVELVMVTWLDIQGKVNTKLLSPHTTYAAYLVIKLAGRAHGLQSFPSEVSIEAGDYVSRGSTRLRRQINSDECSACCFCSGCVLHATANRIGSIPGFCRGEERVLNERKDGWLELELGEFYNDGNEKEVKMCLKEINGQHIKGGLIVEGIELRPKFVI